jgi:hypothetical protein
LGDAGYFAVAIMALGGIADYLVTEPYFLSLVAGTSFTGWSPITTFLFLYGIPFAVSVAAVGTVIGAILGAT